jgi:hypothetical protein
VKVLRSASVFAYLVFQTLEDIVPKGQRDGASYKVITFGSGGREVAAIEERTG